MVTPVKKVPIHLQSSQNRIIIKNGTVVNHDKEEQVDVYIEVRFLHIWLPFAAKSPPGTNYSLPTSNGLRVIPGAVTLTVFTQHSFNVLQN